MSKEQFLLDYKPYTDRWGMVQNKLVDDMNGSPSGNGNLYNAYYILAAAQNGFIDEDFKQTQKAVYAANERLPGLMMRTPSNEYGHNAHDDLIGCAYMSSVIDDGALARRIYMYGINSNPTEIDPDEDPKKASLNKRLFPILKFLSFGKNIKYVWNNINPNSFHVSSWLLRRYDVIATLQLVGFRETGLFGYLFLSTSLLSLLFSNKEKARHNTYIHKYVIARSIENVNFFTKMLSKLIRKKIVKDFGSFGALVDAYFGGAVPPHLNYLKDAK